MTKHSDQCPDYNSHRGTCNWTCVRNSENLMDVDYSTGQRVTEKDDCLKEQARESKLERTAQVMGKEDKHLYG